MIHRLPAEDCRPFLTEPSTGSDVTPPLNPVHRHTLYILYTLCMSMNPVTLWI